MTPHSILIFTDGASKGNPGPGGWGAVLVLPAQNEKNKEAGIMNCGVKEIGGREEVTTNNQMELTAAIQALSIIPNSKFIIHIYSDSTYLINGITTWIYGWEKNGWITAAKKEVENRDLWESLDKLGTGKKIEWHKVAGHADTPGNARADEIASAFAEGASPRLFRGSRTDYKINVEYVGSREGSVKNKAAYSYVSLVDGRVMRHKTWDECKKRVHGKSGARYKKATTSDEEERIVLEFSAS